MSGEPASSAAGGVVAWKLGVAILGVGFVASTLGFLVLFPKTMKEAAVRVAATMIGSAFVGPGLVAAVYSKFPEVFGGGVNLAIAFGMEPWLGLFVVGAPILAVAGLPFWWVLGAVVIWMERRKGKDIAELVADVRQVLP